MNRNTAALVATLLLIASVAINAAHAQAPLSPPEYGIREDEPRTGSHIRRFAVKSSSTPINRTYAELTPEEKAQVHALYESIAPGDEPPFPAEGLKPVYEALRQAQHKLFVSGGLTLVATVERTGQVAQVKAIGSPSPEMTKFAASVLILTKFKPALCKGEPCRMDFPFVVRFDVER